MSISNLQTIIKDLKVKNQFGWSKVLSDEEYEIVLSFTKFLDDDVSFAQRVGYFQKNISEPIICLNCNNEIKIKNRNNAVSVFCSTKCFQSSIGKQYQREQQLKSWNAKTQEMKNDHADLISESKQKKYADPHYRNSEKAKQTCLMKYESETYNNPSQNKITSRENNWESFVTRLSEKSLIPKFRKEDYVKYNSNDIINFHCLECNNEVSLKIKEERGISIDLINCSCQIVKSKYELEIRDWLLTLDSNLDIEMNNRFSHNGKSLELDVYIPSKNIGIEFHGLYWHNNEKKPKKYHMDKWRHFTELGITLIQVFENEWINTPDIVKSIITAKLGFNKSIYARKCVIKEIPNDEYRKFLDVNHMQGSCGAKVKLGLYYEDMLVQLMSFGMSRFNKSFEWENIRSCTKIGHHVTGGFSKLLKYFKRNWNPKNIISFVDLRYFDGSGYIKNGFVELRVSDPNYFYFKTGTLFLESRNKYQKHKLKDKLEIFDADLSEYQNMLNNNYLRIYDSGNKVLGWTNSQ